MTADFTLAQVRADVTAISAAYAANRDNERTHGEIDALLLRVLRLIAGGAEDPAALAAEVLRTGDIAREAWGGSGHRQLRRFAGGAL